MSANQSETGADQSVVARYKKIGKFDGYRSYAFFGFDSPPDTNPWRHFNVPSSPYPYVPLRPKLFFDHNEIFIDDEKIQEEEYQGSSLGEILETDTSDWQQAANETSSNQYRITIEEPMKMFKQISEILLPLEVSVIAIEDSLQRGPDKKAATSTPKNYDPRFDRISNVQPSGHATDTWKVENDRSVETSAQLPEKELKQEAPRDAKNEITQEIDENLKPSDEEKGGAMKSQDEAQGSLPTEDIEMGTSDQCDSMTCIADRKKPPIGSNDVQSEIAQDEQEDLTMLTEESDDNYEETYID